MKNKIFEVNFESEDIIPELFVPARRGRVAFNIASNGYYKIRPFTIVKINTGASFDIPKKYGGVVFARYKDSGHYYAKKIKRMGLYCYGT